MSTFLGFPKGEIPLGYSIIQMHDAFVSLFVSFGYQIFGEDKSNPTLTKVYLIPPATESIGTAWIREVVYVTFSGSQVTFQPLSQALQAFPQAVVLQPKTGGAVASAVTLDGVTVTQDSGTLAAGNSASDNLNHLFDAIRDSSDAAFTGWDWMLQGPPTSGGESHIYGIRKTAVANVTITPNANCYASTLSTYCPAGVQDMNATPPVAARTLAVDLTNGFSYAIQMCARGFAWAHKTISGVGSGAVHCCWADHTQALALVPDSAGFWSKFLSPVELLVGYDGDATTIASYGKPAKYWALFGRIPTQKVYPSANGGDYAAARHPFGWFGVRGVWVDAHNGVNLGGGGAQDQQITLQGTSVFSGDAGPGSNFSLFKQGMGGNAIWDANLYDTIYSGTQSRISEVMGAMKGLDWYKVKGTFADEVRMLAGDPETTAVLNQDLDATTAYTTLNLVSTANLQNAGTLIIGTEPFPYTAKTATSVVGVTRGPVRTKHKTGDIALQGLWFVKMGGSALLAGYEKPV